MIRAMMMLVLVMGITSVGLPQAVAAEHKLGVVNVQEVIDTVEEGKKAKAQLEKEMLKRKGQLDSKQKEYRKLEEEYEKQKLILSASALEEKRQVLETKRAELQRFVYSAQSDMQKRELELTGGLFKKIRAVVNKIGQEGGYTFIWEKNEGGIVYAGKGLDLTEKVIKEYNKAYKK